MKEWNEFENQDVANLLSGISYTVNRLKNKLSKKDYQALAGDIILLKNKISILLYSNLPFFKFAGIYTD